MVNSTKKRLLKYYLSLGQVFIPNKAYIGQNETKLVKTKIAAITTNIIPKVPVTVPEKYNPANTAARMNLIILSVLPMFFFIIVFLNLIKTLKTRYCSFMYL